MSLLMLFSATSCNTTKENVSRRSTHRHENTVSRNTRHKDSSKHHGTHGGGTSHGVSEEWASLTIHLGHGDNKQLYKELKRWLGTPYKHAASECGTGTDCSGMVMEVYRTVYDKKIERNSARIYERNCQPVDRDDLREGDLVFFDTSGNGGISHVGIYLKENKFVHTSSSRGVMVSDLNQRYWNTRYHCGGRVITK